MQNNQHATRARVAAGNISLFQPTRVSVKRRATAPAALDMDTDTARLEPEHRVVMPCNSAESTQHVAEHAPAILSGPSTPLSSSSSSSSCTETESMSDSVLALSSSSSEHVPLYRRPGQYVCPVAVHDERDWGPTLVSTLSARQKKLLFNMIWPSQCKRFILFSTHAYNNSEHVVVVDRSACAPYLLPSFDLLFSKKWPDKDINTTKQPNLLYSADFYATAALLFAPEQNWPRLTNDQCLAAINHGQVVGFAYDPAVEPHMKLYVSDRRMFLSAHHILLAMPITRSPQQQPESRDSV